MTTTAGVDHHAQTFTDGDQYRAECRCGWASEWSTYDDEATWAAEDHREITARQVEGFDRFMSGLLDLQDDLAAASMWLAEHWCADLPVPGWYGHGDDRDADRPAVRVTVYCDPAELARAADLLGVASVEDPAPDERGNRYARAARRFGRVEVEAYTSLPVTCGECSTSFEGSPCPTCGQAADASRSLVLAGDQVALDLGAA